MYRDEASFVIGIDGGGTKTEAVLLDRSGSIAAAGLGGAVNTRFVSAERARASIERAVLPVMARIDPACVQAAGVCLVGDRAMAEDVLAKAGFAGRVIRLTETEVAFRRAGLRECRGVSVIAGTGSSFSASDGRGNHRSLGGWGMAVGDEGSGFDIGLRAIKAAGRALDGRGPETKLLDMLLEVCGVRTFGHLLQKCCRPNLRYSEISGLSRVVASAAEAGDAVARDILSAAGTGLGEDAAFIAGQLFRPEDEFDVVLAGGVFNAGDLVVQPLKERLLAEFPRARIHTAGISAGESAARLALESLG